MMEILQFLDLFDWVFEAIIFVLFILFYIRHIILLRHFRIITKEEVELMSEKERRQRIVDILTDGLLEWLKEERGEQLEEGDKKELEEHLSKRIKEKEDG